MINRMRIYRAVGRRAPITWKLMRLALWGRINFNDLKTWQQCYERPSPEELQKLTNRIPNVVTAALELASPFDSILEISAGFGNFIGKVSATKERYATEFSPAAAEYLRSQGIATEIAALPTLPYKDNSLDIIASFSVLEHLPNKATLRETFYECHRICREGMILSVPFGCMQPWTTLIHNFDFTKELVLELCGSRFELKSWQVIKDGVTTRSLCFLAKQ